MIVRWLGPLTVVGLGVLAACAVGTADAIGPGSVLGSGDDSGVVGPGDDSGGINSSGGSGSGGADTGTASGSGGADTGTASGSGGADTGTASGSGADTGTGSGGVDSGSGSGGVDSGSGSGSGGTPLPSNCGSGTAGGGCAPQSLAPCTPGYAPPANSAHACSAADVTAFYNDCINQPPLLQTCDGSDLLSPNCFPCLVSQPNAPTWGAVIQYQGVFSLNLGGCYSLIGGSAACATATQEQAQCENQVCDATCSGATQAQFDACSTSADTGACAKFVTAGKAACPTSITNAAACGGTATTFLQAYTAVAKKFCE